MRYVIFETKFGFFGILGHQDGILRTSLPVADRRSAGQHLLSGLAEVEFDPDLLPNIQNQIKSYFSGTYIEFDTEIPLLINELSKFSQDILNACLEIPYGRMVSYGELAKMANHPKAARAVGNAMGNNPIPLIIPCHRVVKSTGATGGFQRNQPGGRDLKKRMLNLESNLKP
jgi:methylated-DNA-[protein]-cysteine S-methyltransferase